MRQSRLAKYRKKHKKLILLTKIMVILYASIVSMSVLTSATKAYFNFGTTVSTTISTANEWWDGSKLEFKENATDVVRSCPPVEIAVSIKNIGEDMTKAGKFEVYYSEEGNPEKKGDKIAEGEILPLQSNQTTELKFEVNKEGFYQFSTYERPTFNNNEDNILIWSNKVKVQCPEDKNNNKEESENTDIEEAESADDTAENGEENEEEGLNDNLSEEITDESIKEENPEDSANDENSSTNDDQMNEDNPVPEEEENDEGNSEGQEVQGEDDANEEGGN